jgi:hypothetical protein
MTGRQSERAHKAGLQRRSHGWLQKTGIQTLSPTNVEKG